MSAAIVRNAPAQPPYDKVGLVTTSVHGHNSRSQPQTAERRHAHGERIFLENHPGALAQVAQVLADAKVNVVALLGSTSGTQGSAQVVVDNINKAKKALAQAGRSYTEGTVEQFELNNKPGALAEVTGKLAKKGINVDSAFATVPKGAKKAVLFLATSQPTA